MSRDVLVGGGVRGIEEGRMTSHPDLLFSPDHFRSSSSSSSASSSPFKSSCRSGLITNSIARRRLWILPRNGCRGNVVRVQRPLLWMRSNEISRDFNDNSPPSLSLCLSLSFSLSPCILPSVCVYVCLSACLVSCFHLRPF